MKVRDKLGRYTRTAANTRLAATGRYKRWRCRCTRCWKRCSRKKPPWLDTMPRCCVRPHWVVDWYRQTRRDRALCYCPRVPWQPHRLGYCAAECFNTQYEIEITLADAVCPF